MTVTAAVVALAFLAMAAAETARPLRRRVESRLRRTARNVTMGGLSLAVITLLQAPVIAPVAAWTERRGWGVLRLVDLPPAAALVLGILLMDYTLWHWHRINHRVPFFWRFHLVHHVDRDMDASTALRFHFGEMTFLRRLEAPADPRYRTEPARDLDLPAASLRFDPVSPLEHAPSFVCGARPRSNRRDAAHARDPPFGLAKRNRQQLVEPPVRLGLPSMERPCFRFRRRKSRSEFRRTDARKTSRCPGSC